MNNVTEFLPFLVPLVISELALLAYTLYHILTHKSYKRGNRTLCFAVTYGYNAFFWDNSIAVGLLPAMVHWWLFGVWIIGLIVLFSVLVKSYTGVLLGTGGSVLGVYLISFFPKAWKYTPTTLMESASLLIGTKSIEDYGIAVLITILLVVICLIVSITVMNRKQL